MRRNLRIGRAVAASSSGERRAARALLLGSPIVTALVLAACGGDRAPKPGESLVERARKQAASPNVPTQCAPGTDDALGLAVTAYVKDVQPKPQRFLASVGTDSALPEPARLALQDRGPTYLFPASAEQQAQMRAVLHEKGDYTTLLVVLREATRRDSIVAVRLDGHFVGGEEEGKSTGPRRYQVTCAAGRWSVGPSSAERGA